MRLRAILFILLALGAAGYGALRIGEASTAYVERTTAAQAARSLDAADETWAEVATDGLIVTLSGAAPDEGARLRAAEILRQIVDPRRVRDETTLAASDPLAPPPFALELLRNDGEVSLIGLAPEGAGRAAVAEALTEAGLDGEVSDMIEIVAQDAPEGWPEALRFGLDALARLSRAKITVAPGRVEIAAVAEDEAARAALETALQAARPQGVELVATITAPRPTIAPFRVSYALEGGAGRLEDCTAETAEDAAVIGAAAGLDASACALGLGAPSQGWAETIAAGIAAVRGLGGGRFAAVDIDVKLTGPDDAEPESVIAAGAALQEALPDVFSLTVVAPPPPHSEPAAATPVALRFDAVLAEDGGLRIEGPVRDETSREAIAGVAAALFGHDRVVDATVVAAELPDGWPGRLLTGMEALALMKEGSLQVTPDLVRLDGWAEDADGASKVATLFEQKEIGPTEVAVRFDAETAEAERAAREALADPAGVCLKALAAVQQDGIIAFAPGSATLDDSAVPTIEALTAVFAECPPLDFEVAGHTDSQGDAEANEALSLARAETVKAALEAEDLAHLRFFARGYGEILPVADNDTEEGRAANRRIEFTLVGSQFRPKGPADVVERPGVDGPY